MQTFYHPDLGRFTSNRSDLSDLAGKYYEVAKSAMAVRAEFAKRTIRWCPCGRCRAAQTLLLPSGAPNCRFENVPVAPPALVLGDVTLDYRNYSIVKAPPAPPAPEKTEVERAWDYLVLAAEASRYNT